MTQQAPDIVVNNSGAIIREFIPISFPKNLHCWRKWLSAIILEVFNIQNLHLLP